MYHEVWNKCSRVEIKTEFNEQCGAPGVGFVVTQERSLYLIHDGYGFFPYV